MLKIIRFLVVSLLLFGAVNCINASEQFKFGLFGSVNYNRTEGDLRQFEGIGDSIPRIASGSNFGFSLGVLGKFSISAKVFVSANFGFVFHNSSNVSSISINEKIGREICLREENELRFRNSRFVFSPEFHYVFLPNLSFFGGVEIGYNLPSNYSMFLNRECYDTTSKVTTIYAIEYPNEGKPNYPITTQLNFGFEYQIPTTILNLFNLSVNARYTFGFTNISKNYTSDVNSFQLMLKFFPIHRESPITPIVKKSVILPEKEIVQPPLPSLPVSIANFELSERQIKIDVVGVEDSAYVPAAILYRKEVVKHFVPLLNYIFFEYGNYVVPRRYFQLDSASRGDFSESKLLNLSLLDVYHHILNIIGSRLTQYPDAKITIVGCNSNIGEEEGNRELSKKRAEAVSKYLVEVWGINPKRIVVQERNLPSKPSSEATSEGVEENQRVEIYSETPEILAPVSNLDTLLFASPKILRFYISRDSSFKILQTKLVLRQNLLPNSAIIKDQAFDSIDLAVNNLFSKPSVMFGPIDYQFIFTMLKGNDTVEESISGSIPAVELITGKNNLQKLSLLLFDFNSSNLDALQMQSLRKFAPIIQGSKVIEVAGYTDAIGNEEYNLNLSAQRARKVAEYLKIQGANVVGYGEAKPFIDGKTPEGRFYLRTVQIIFGK